MRLQLLLYNILSVLCRGPCIAALSGKAPLRSCPGCALYEENEKLQHVLLFSLYTMPYKKGTRGVANSCVYRCAQRCSNPLCKAKQNKNAGGSNFLFLFVSFLYRSCMVQCNKSSLPLLLGPCYHACVVGF